MRVLRLMAFLTCLAAAAMCVFAVYAVDPTLQYMALAPSSQAEADESSQLSQVLSRLKTAAEDWEDMVSAWCAVTEKRGVTLTGPLDRACAARLCGLYGDRDALPFRALVAGRWPYAEELRDGARVIVLSEQLASKLFGGTDVLSQYACIGKTPYRVIGVMRHEDGMDGCAALTALSALDGDGLDMDALTVWATPLPGAGAATRFGAQMTQWRQGGTVISLSKERERALLPPRAFLLLCGYALWLVGIQAYRAYTQKSRAQEKVALQARYASDMLPRLALTRLIRAGGLLALLSAGLALVYGVLCLLRAFPEWIPASPTQWRSIVETFKSATPATIMELRTPQLLSLRLYRHALCALCAALAFLAARPYGILRKYVRLNCHGDGA